MNGDCCVRFSLLSGHDRSKTSVLRIDLFVARFSAFRFNETIVLFPSLSFLFSLFFSIDEYNIKMLIVDRFSSWNNVVLNYIGMVKILNAHI